MNSLMEVIDLVLQPYAADWRTYALNWVISQLKSIDVNGAAVLDEEETPELPEKLLKKLDAEWSPEPAVVAKLQFHIRKWQSNNKISDEEVSKDLKAIADSLRVIDFPVSQKLRDDYDATVEVTWYERLTDTNFKDVVRYHRNLREYLYQNVEEMVQWHMAKILEMV